MPDIKATLTRKIGPLPVWGWVGVVAGGVFVGRKLLGGKAGGATSILSGASAPAETGFGESALPVDVTGRAAVDVAPTPVQPGYDSLPIDYTGLGGFDVFPDMSASTPVTPQPATTTAGGGVLVRPCTRETKVPGLGRYADAPNRECPQGWHLNRIPLTPCFGYCVRN